MWRLRVVLFIAVAFAAVLCGPCESSEVRVLSGVKSEAAIRLHRGSVKDLVDKFKRRRKESKKTTAASSQTLTRRYLKKADVSNVLLDTVKWARAGKSPPEDVIMKLVKETSEQKFENLDFIKQLAGVRPRPDEHEKKAVLQLLNDALLYDNAMLMIANATHWYYMYGYFVANKKLASSATFYDTLRSARELFQYQDPNSSTQNYITDPYTTTEILQELTEHNKSLNSGQYEARSTQLGEVWKEFLKSQHVLGKHVSLVVARFITPPPDIFTKMFKAFKSGSGEAASAEESLSTAKKFMDKADYGALLYIALCNQKANFIKEKFKDVSGILKDFKSKSEYTSIEDYKENSLANQMRKKLRRSE